MDRELFFDVVDKYDRKCDGCSHEFAEGEQYLSGINSCCGGCYRSLCMHRVEWIADNTSISVDYKFIDEKKKLAFPTS
jgi:hypothetical protein